MNHLTPCQQYFQDEGLKMPFIPKDELDHMKIVPDSMRVIGTRETNNSLYDIAAFANEVITGTPTQDYVLVGRGGHGTKPPIHYYVVKGHLAIFLQLKPDDVKSVNEQLMAVKFIFDRMADLEKTRPLEKDKRLVIVHSEITGTSQWQWSGEEVHTKEAGKNILFSALETLTKMKKK